MGSENYVKIQKVGHTGRLLQKIDLSRIIFIHYLD